MKLSFSNIAWSAGQDEYMYQFLSDSGYHGIEIAPTRIFPDKPYDHIDEAESFAQKLKNTYHLEVSSMQSIWYGRDENIFACNRIQQILAVYTQKAIDFAAHIGCRNLVFGCPKNRNIPDDMDKFRALQTAEGFFGFIGKYAASNNIKIAIEPNPKIYGTNFINYTKEAFDLAKRIKGLAVNVDLGTIIENQESLLMVSENIEWINHIHISEPGLGEIQKRSLHRELAQILRNTGYSGFVSAEMKNCGNIETVKNIAEYVRGIFGDI